MFHLLLSLCFLCAAALGADEYEVRMTRPSKVGQRSLIAGNFQASESMQVKADGKVMKEEETTIEMIFEAEEEAVEVTQLGKTTRARAKLLKIEGKFNGAPLTELKTGDVIESAPDGAHNKITVNGEAATRQQDKLARGIISTSREGDVGDDDVFGSGRKVKVGEEWPINPAAAAKGSAQQGIPGLKPEDFKGTMKLVEVAEIGGKPHLRLRGAMDMKGAGMPVPNGPPGLKMDQMVVSVKMEGDFPVDPEIPIPTSEMIMAMRMDASGDLERNGRKIKLETIGKFMRERKMRSKPIP